MGQDVLLSFFRVIPFLLILVVFTVLVRRQRLKKEDLGWVQPQSYIPVFLWMIGFLSLVCIEEWLVLQFGWLDVQAWTHTGLGSWIRIVGAVILAPIAEELIFRGMLITKLSQRFSMHAAIIIQAVFFVLMHSFAYENTLASNIGIIQTFTDAVLYGYARYTTRTILTSSLMHMSGNLIATLERFIHF